MTPRPAWLPSPRLLSPRRAGPLLFLGLVWLLVAGPTAAWIFADHGLNPPSDSEYHLLLAQSFALALSEAGLQGLWWAFLDSPVQWPPLSYVFYGSLAALLGDGPQTVRASSLLLLPLLAWGVYLLGRALSTRLAGCLAAALTVSAVGVVGHARQVTLDLPCAVAVVFGALALVRSRGFGSLRGTLLFGAACSLCLLTRIQALFFLLFPALALAARALWQAPDWRTRGRRAAGLVGGLGLVLASSSLLWVGRTRLFFNNLLSHADPSEVPSFEAGSGFLDGLAYYGAGLGQVAGWPVLVCALACLPRLVRRRAPGRELLLLWVAGGVVLLSLSVSRETRYLLSAVPAVALLAAIGLEQLARSRSRPLGALLLLLGCLPTLLLAGHGDERLKGWVDPSSARAPDLGDHGQIARQLVAGLPAGAGQGALLLFNRQNAELTRLAVEAAPLLRGRPWCLRGLTSRRLCLHEVAAGRRVLVLDSGPDLPPTLLWSGRGSPSTGAPRLGLYWLPDTPAARALIW